MAIPTIFTQSSKQQIAAYDWYDSYTNTAYKKFYGSVGIITGGTKVYFLTDRVLYSGMGDDTTNATYTEVNGETKTLTFDITFKNDTRIGGTAYINYSTYTWGTGTLQAVLTLYHVTSGGTETSLGTVTGLAVSTAAATDKRQLVKFELTEKAFIPGETLRLKVAITETGDGAAAKFYHDSSNAYNITVESVPTSLELNIPFKIII